MAKRILDEELRFSIIINGNEAQKELFELEASTRKLTSANKELKAEQARLVSQGKKNTEEYKRLSAEIKQNNQAISLNKAKMKELQNQIGITGLTMAQLTAKASQLKLQLRHMLEGSADYKKLDAELQQITARISELNLKSKATKVSIGSIADGFSKYAALGASVIATLTGVVLSIQKMIDYNGKLADAQSNVQKTTGLTNKEVNEISKSFGLMKTRTARIELLGLAEEAGRLGIEGVQNIKDFVEVANQMKVALGDDLGDEQIRDVGKMVNIYKVGEKTGRDFKNSLLSLGSAINEVSASGSNQAGFLVDYLKRQAGVAAQTRLSAADNIAYAATFDELGQSVEVSATAMNKIWIDMFTNADVYAKIAGVSIGEFNKILNTDSNKAMILFLKGLNGNNEGLTVMAEKLKDLEVGGARGVAALAALSSNTELLETRQQQSNKALTEAVSLTNEYNLKNNNLAANIEKVKKALIGAFSSETIINGMSSLITRFGMLIGAIDDLNESQLKEIKTKSESIKANKQLAEESNKLLDEYNELTKEGIEPTEEAKQRLREVTLLLQRIYGDSIFSIDAETGALKLNTDAVRENIRLKRLAADDDAYELASKLEQAKENQGLAKKSLELLKAEFETSKALFSKANREAANQEGKSSEQIRKDAAEAKKQQELFRAAGIAVNKKNQEIRDLQKRIYESEKGLNESGYTAEDAAAAFKTNHPVKTSEPEEGDFMTDASGTLLIYKNGKWVPYIVPNDPDPEARKKALEEAKKRAEELLKLQREAEDQRLQLMKEGFDKEMLLEDFNHYRKIEDLQARLVSEKLIAQTKDKNLKDSYIANNQAINSQIESELQLHELRKATILEKGFQNQIELKHSQFEREQQERITAFNNEIAALGNNEKAREKLQREFDKESLEREKAHLETLQTEVKRILDSSQFEGFDIKLLSPEQLQAIKDRLRELGLSISEINALLAIMQGNKGDVSSFASELDILGFSIEQWDTAFENLDTLAGKIRMAEMAVGAFTEAWGMYNKFVSANQQKELQQFEKATDQKKEKQRRLLESGYINQRQYDTAVRALEEASERKKAEMEYKAAKREKQMNIASILMNTAVGVSKALAQGGFVLGVPWSTVVAVLGGIQLGIAAAQPLPAKGYESGYYNVQREQDGKLFKAAFGGESRTGVVDKPTVFLAGEGGKNFPEMIIDGRSFKQMSPDVKQALYSELARVKGFERGYNQNQTAAVQFTNQSSTASVTPDYALLIATLNKTNNLLEVIERDGFVAVIDKNFRNLKKLQEELDKYNKLKQKNLR